MFIKEILIKNETGLHARPASELTKLCQKYESDIKIKNGNIDINPKSIISILAGGVNKGSLVMLQVEGIDEKKAGEEITDFINHLTD